MSVAEVIELTEKWIVDHPGIVSVLVILTPVIILLLKWNKELLEWIIKKMEGKNSKVEFGTMPMGGSSREEQEIDRIEHLGVLWLITVPKPDLLDSYKNRNLVAEAKREPRCPKCETELLEENAFLGFIRWKCVQCKYKKLGRKSFDVASNEVDKIANKGWEDKTYEDIKDKIEHD